MRKNLDLHLDDVRDNLRDKRGYYESGADLLADVTKAIFWAGVEADPFGDGEGFNSFDVWGVLDSACKIDCYVGHSRAYLDITGASMSNACYVVFKQSDHFVHVCGVEPTSRYEAMYNGECLIIKVQVLRDGQIVATCL